MSGEQKQQFSQDFRPRYGWGLLGAPLFILVLVMWWPPSWTNPQWPALHAKSMFTGFGALFFAPMILPLFIASIVLAALVLSIVREFTKRQYGRLIFPFAFIITIVDIIAVIYIIYTIYISGKVYGYFEIMTIIFYINTYIAICLYIIYIFSFKLYRTTIHIFIEAILFSGFLITIGFMFRLFRSILP